ncbi:ferredoxin [Clostridia bacterium]|nr:ferredoxin [Clostridia bacterium]
MAHYYHSIKLVDEQCIGCTNCIKRCPTEAIRVRGGKAEIINERCIDCGTCIRVCASRAKRATTQPLSILNEYKCKIAIPAPTLYGQFKNMWDVNAILTGVKKLGFDDVFEVARAAELVTQETKRYIANLRPKKTVISSACPVIIRLISMRFPTLIDNLLPIKSPMEIAAAAAREYYVNKGFSPQEVGVFFIGPCGAKSTYVLNPLGVKRSDVSGVISISDIYMPLRNAISNLKEIEPLCQGVAKGVKWAAAGGESENVMIENAIAVDGLDNVVSVLESLEDGQISDVDFIEALACVGGCVGGPLTILNGYVGKNYVRRTERNSRLLPASMRRTDGYDESKIDFYFNAEIESADAMRLDEDMGAALNKYEKINKIYEGLPHIDCGSCGSPTCLALAEDVVQANANVEDCVFMLRKKVRDLAGVMMDLSSKMPQTLVKGDKTT